MPLVFITGSAKTAVESKDAESILINVAGRLLLFQTDRSASAGKAANVREKWVNSNVIDLGFSYG